MSCFETGTWRELFIIFARSNQSHMNATTCASTEKLFARLIPFSKYTLRDVYGRVRNNE